MIELDFLIRKNKGKKMLLNYKELFLVSGFSPDELSYVNLEISDAIVDQVKSNASRFHCSNEFINVRQTWTDSKLLNLLYAENLSEKCYVFSDEVYYCGMYLVQRESAIINSLKVAKFSKQNTFFAVGINMDFFLTLNYYDENHSDDKEVFDIQIRKKGSSS
jgi:hypothetical protein